METETDKLMQNAEKYKTRSISYEGYNSLYDKSSGEIYRWNEDGSPTIGVCPIGPEVVDIEVSRECRYNCKYCYKQNSSSGKNMTFERFKKVCDKLPDSVYIVNFGIGDIGSNKKLWKMMEYVKNKGIDITISINGNNMKESDYVNLVKYCSCVSVSLHKFSDCYETIGKLTEYGVNRVEINCLLSKETHYKCLCVLNDIPKDKRLSKVSKVMYQWLIQEGYGSYYEQIDDPKSIKMIVEKALENKIEFGFNGCSAGNYVAGIKDMRNRDDLLNEVSPCGASLYEYHIDIDGIGYPCPFIADDFAYVGIDLVKVNNFREVWYDKETMGFRNKLLKNCRLCPLFNIHLVELVEKS